MANSSLIPITKANLKDLFKLARLERLCFSKQDTWPLIELINTLIAPNITRLKMDSDAAMIAFLSAEIRGAERIGWISTIAVAPDWRHQGLAQRLLLAGEVALGTPRVRLSVRESNLQAIRLYQKAGYRYVSTWERYYIGGENGLMFEKTRRAAIGEEDH